MENIESWLEVATWFMGIVCLVWLAGMISFLRNDAPKYQFRMPHYRRDLHKEMPKPIFYTILVLYEGWLKVFFIASFLITLVITLITLPDFANRRSVEVFFTSLVIFAFSLFLLLFRSVQKKKSIEKQSKTGFFRISEHGLLLKLGRREMPIGYAKNYTDLNYYKAVKAFRANEFVALKYEPKNFRNFSFNFEAEVLLGDRRSPRSLKGHKNIYLESIKKKQLVWPYPTGVILGILIVLLYYFFLEPQMFSGLSLQLQKVVELAR